MIETRYIKRVIDLGCFRLPVSIRFDREIPYTIDADVAMDSKDADYAYYEHVAREVHEKQTLAFVLPSTTVPKTTGRSPRPLVMQQLSECNTTCFQNMCTQLFT